MNKIKVTIGVQTLGELVSEYNRLSKSPLRAVVDSVKNKEWCLEIVGHTGETEEITTAKGLATALKRFSSKTRVQMIAKIASQKNK